jgi:hypothetical protein
VSKELEGEADGDSRRLNHDKWKLPFAISLILLIGGCRAEHADKGEPARELEPEVASLGIVGYNYTNRTINTFTVDGAGGGNLYVSSPTSGGGGTTCCVPYVPGIESKKLTVKWQYGGCYYHTKSSDSDETFEHIFPFFKEVVVDVEKPLPTRANYVEIHFYPDGQVKAYMTENASSPLLKLPEERQDRSRLPICPNDKKPEGG